MEWGEGRDTYESYESVESFFSEAFNLKHEINRRVFTLLLLYLPFIPPSPSLHPFYVLPAAARLW